MVAMLVKQQQWRKTRHIVTALFPLAAGQTVAKIFQEDKLRNS
jgi:hypothetical protein